MTNEYDYLVIGGGSGGVASARRAASYGAKVLLVEAKPDKLGGTCVNVGCVPKKMMWHAADMADKKRVLYDYCLLSEEESQVKYGDFDWPRYKAKRDAYVKMLNGVYGRNLTNDGVDYLFGTAKFLNSDADVEVTITKDQELTFLEADKTTFAKGDKITLKSKNVLVAVGGQPLLPPSIEGAELGTTSDGFFLLEKQPKSVALVGAGYIGVELTGTLHALGSDAHFIIRGETVLRDFDEMIQQAVTSNYEKMGVNIHKKSNIVKVEDSPAGKKVIHLDTGDKLEVDTLIWTIGRNPLTDPIELKKAGIDLDNKGQIIVDKYQQSSNPKIFSLGDVTGPIPLTPVAIAAGRKLSNRLFGTKEMSDDHLDYSNVPSVVFSIPESGTIGLTEKQAIDQYGKDKLKIYNTTFGSMYNLPLDPAKKFQTKYKLVTVLPEEKVVGLHMVGDSSSEILQGFGVAIKMGATKKDFDNCVAIHPSSAEELVTLK